MKLLLAMSALIAVAFPAPAAASPEKDAVKGVIRTIKQGGDLGVVYQGAITAREVASLKRVAKCSAVNLMRQQGGYFTVVWDCGSKGALGMKVVVQDGQISSISTMEIGMRPNTEGR